MTTAFAQVGPRGAAAAHGVLDMLVGADASRDMDLARQLQPINLTWRTLIQSTLSVRETPQGQLIDALPLRDGLCFVLGQLADALHELDSELDVDQLVARVREAVDAATDDSWPT